MEARPEDAVVRHLGPLQAEVMGIFWSRGSATVGDVVAAVNGGRARPLAYSTVLTLVRRLWQRGLLTRERQGRGFVYRPAATRSDLLGNLSDALVERLLTDFGELGIARFSKRVQGLSPRERAALRQLLEEDG